MLTSVLKLFREVMESSQGRRVGLPIIQSRVLSSKWSTTWHAVQKVCFARFSLKAFPTFGLSKRRRLRKLWEESWLLPNEQHIVKDTPKGRKASRLPPASLTHIVLCLEFWAIHNARPGANDSQTHICELESHSAQFIQSYNTRKVNASEGSST